MYSRFIITLLIIGATCSMAFARGNSDRNFGGVGIDGVPLPNGEIEVRQLVTGAPAHRAGIRIGDIITNIDSKPTLGSNFRDMIDHRLRGRAGTKVLIKIRRPGSDKELRFNLTRKQLVIGHQRPSRAAKQPAVKEETSQ
jgi:C-terminal processing protease CtpA/Prc